MEFAPVLIPTLNRYGHLQKCLGSLSRCTWADQTEVYVALDYPPSDKYVEGWKRNKEFLEHCGDLGFKKLHVIEREENYGFGGGGNKGNIGELVSVIRKQYDYYIISEDDNVFAPAFLDYMNKGFEKFKNDESVIALCGYRYYAKIKYAENTYFRQNVDFCAWGLGRWTSRKFPLYTYHDFRKLLSFRSFVKVYRRSGIEKAIYFLNCCHSKWDGRMIDMAQSIYLILNDLYEIMPTVALVKNIGMDDTGVNFNHTPSEIKEKFENQEISKERYFEFVGTGHEYFKENQIIYKNEYPNKLPFNIAFKKLMKALVKLIIYK
ncbi:MAG: glycosyltransferase [Alphaproteobacteria bacterium]|nr:glycosyltransferase [Alphaproteobacteria bacterium]